MEFEQAQAERDVAAAKADQAQAVAQRAALDLEKDTLHAPISGVISATRSLDDKAKVCLVPALLRAKIGENQNWCCLRHGR